MDKSPRLKKLVETVADKAGWKKPLRKGHALGIACSSCFGSHAAEIAEVSVEKGKVQVHRIVVAVDCGIAVAPNTLEAQIEGAVALALTATLKDEITIEGGRTKQNNFDGYRLLTIGEMPKVEVHIVNSYEALGGIGEPALPPVSPAVCNAIFAATGTRVRRLPIAKLS
jgi:isoquinoline 1-oxidoreductase beta subunit